MRLLFSKWRIRERGTCRDWTSRFSTVWVLIKNKPEKQQRNQTGSPILEEGDILLNTTLAETNDWQQVDLPVVRTLRHFCIETLSSYTEDNQACISEVDLLDDKGQPIDKTKWEVVYVSSEQADKNLGCSGELVRRRYFFILAYRSGNGTRTAAPYHCGHKGNL